MTQKARTHFFRNAFITGLLILIPLYVTYLLISFLFSMLSGVGGPLLGGLFQVLNLDGLALIEPLAPVVSLFLSLAVIFILGLVGTNIVGREILAAVHALLMRLPVVSSVYGAAKQIVEAFQGPGGNFQRVVLLQFPYKGCWMMGLAASERPDTMNLSPSERMLTVFVPTTPNPTSGFLALVPPEDVVHLNYNVEDAFKFIVSGGTVGKNFGRPTGETISESCSPLGGSKG
ncbi:MAG: DUF502 domain-containing protein [Candidatus Binatia bacterium]